MWQRIQTVYLLLASLTLFACSCIPVAEIEPAKMGVNSIVTNLVILTDGQISSFLPAPLFGVIIVAAVLSLLTIAKYQNRKLQAKWCVLASTLCVLWYAAFAGLYFGGFLTGKETCTLHANYSVTLPLIAIILLWMARRSILKDEALVRAADRIR